MLLNVSLCYCIIDDAPRKRKLQTPYTLKLRKTWEIPNKIRCHMENFVIAKALFTGLMISLAIETFKEFLRDQSNQSKNTTKASFRL